MKLRDMMQAGSLSETFVSLVVIAAGLGLGISLLIGIPILAVWLLRQLP